MIAEADLVEPRFMQKMIGIDAPLIEQLLQTYRILHLRKCTDLHAEPHLLQRSCRGLLLCFDGLLGKQFGDRVGGNGGRQRRGGTAPCGKQQSAKEYPS